MMVKTTGKKKEEGTDPKTNTMVRYTIACGNRDNGSDVRKLNDLDVIMRFVQSQIGGNVHRGRNTIFMELPAIEGDTRWTEMNVIRFVDIQRCDDDEGAVRLAKNLKSRLETFGDLGTGKVGVGIIDYYLEKMYMKYDKWSV